jgi:Transposase DDE domain group 1
MASTRLALSVEVMPGNETAPSHSMPGILAWLDGLSTAERPTLMRGDIAFGTDAVMGEAERRGQAYLTKLLLTKNVKALIQKRFGNTGWIDAGQGWERVDDELTLTGWHRSRRVVVLRRKLMGEVLLAGKEADTQGQFALIESGIPTARFEYAALVTSTNDDIFALAQLYRDRSDAENNFDELKDQWGWGGFTTQDLARCRLIARMVALIYNWWTLFVRLAQPHKHFEAIISRPLLLHSVAAQTRHGGQTQLTIASTHATQALIQSVLTNLAAFLGQLKSTAKHLTETQRLRAILDRALAKVMLPPPIHRYY